MVITLTPEIEQALVEAAQQQGVPPERLALTRLAALDGICHRRSGLCAAPVGAQFSGPQLERRAATSRRAAAGGEWPLSLGQTSNLYGFSAHSGVNTPHFGQLVRGSRLDWDDCFAGGPTHLI